MTLFEALTGGAFDRLNWRHSGEFKQNFSKKSNARGFARGGGGMGGFGIDRYIKATTVYLQTSVSCLHHMHDHSFVLPLFRKKPNYFATL